MNEIEKKLEQAVKDITPDIYGKIASVPVNKMEKKEWSRECAGRQYRKHRLHYAAGIAMVCAVCILILIGVRSTWIVQGISTVSLDVNPSIELKVDHSGTVVDVMALNEDGVEILDGMNLKKTELNVAVNALMGSMLKKGYFSGTDNVILVTVDDKDAQIADNLRQKIIGGIHQTLKENNCSTTVYSQKLDRTDRTLSKLAETYRISLGKAMFLEKLSGLDMSLTIEKLAPMSIEEIAVLIKEKNLDISGVVEMEQDDSLKDNIEDAIEDMETDDKEDTDEEEEGQNSDQAGTPVKGDKGNADNRKNKKETETKDEEDEETKGMNDGEEDIKEEEDREKEQDGAQQDDNDGDENEEEEDDGVNADDDRDDDADDDDREEDGEELDEEQD